MPKIYAVEFRLQRTLQIEETIAQVNAALDQNPWHFMEETRYIDVSGLSPLSNITVGDCRPVLTQVLKALVVDMLREAGWTVLPGHDSLDDRWIQVGRPAHLPPVVRFVEGAWAPVVSEIPAPAGATP